MNEFLPGLAISQPLFLKMFSIGVSKRNFTFCSKPCGMTEIIISPL